MQFLSTAKGISMTLEIGSNLRLIGILVILAVLVVEWWGFRARGKD